MPQWRHRPPEFRSPQRRATRHRPRAAFILAANRLPPPPNPNVRYFDATAIRSGLPWQRMLAALDAALKGDVMAPLRTQHAIDVPDMPAASLLLMPAWRAGHRIGVKLVTVFPGNRERNQRAVAAVYALFDARDGRVLALFDGEELTARRTAGASAYAAVRLARADAHHLVMLGAGRLARGLIEAHRFVRPIDRVSLWSRTKAHAETVAAAMADAGLPVRACGDLEAAVRSADIVCCATLATAPIVRGAWLAPGTHLDLVGAFKAHMRETDDDAMQRADLIVVDDRGAALAEGGDIVQAVRSGAIAESKIVAELRDFARGAHAGRRDGDQVTVFKSVGFALEDLAAAEAVYDAHFAA
jgi:alanine dehydrogenase